MAAICVVVKPTTQGVKYSLEVAPDAGVGHLKDTLEKASAIPAAEQRLIFKGQILKDERTIDSYGIGNEAVLYLVRSRATPGSTTSTDASQGTATRAAQPTAAAPAPTMNTPLGMPPGFDGNQDAMMQQMMNTPMFQEMMNNPALIQSMLSNNPAIQQLMERNPELASVLNDPATIRQAMMLASNPALRREHMRHADRAMHNIESMPEGFNALRRMFETVQEPLLNAASEMDPLAAMLGAAPGAAPGTAAAAGGADAQARSANPSTAPAGTTPSAAPIDMPFPNPWAPPGTGAGGAAGQQQPLGMPAGLGLGSGLGGLGGLGSGPQMEMVNQMMQQPQMRDMMSRMMSSPGFIDQVLSTNPQLRQMVDSAPGMREMLANPAMVESMLNPQNLQAMMGMQSLMQGAGGAGAGGLGGLGGAGRGGQDMASMMNMMQGLFGGAGAGLGGGFGAPAPVADPQVTYASQISALEDMGFMDRDANVRALQATGGNVSAAVERLLSGGA